MAEAPSSPPISQKSESKSLFWPYLALVAVCIFWGTTYAGIKVALESFPPFQLMSLRFLLSGSLMLLFAKWKGMAFPQGRELWLTALYGLISLGIGNLCLTLGETLIPSGLTSIIIATSPFWIVGLEAAVPGGAKFYPPTLIGMLVGLAGVLFLVTPSEAQIADRGKLILGTLILQLGCFGWCFGSILQRRLKSPVHPAVAGGIQQFAVGAGFLLPALWSFQTQPAEITQRGVTAVIYLVIFGSFVGYTSFVYAMATLPVAVVSIYMYVNTAVACLLGWLLLNEGFGWREFTGMMIIFAGSLLIKFFQNRAPKPTEIDDSAKPPLPRPTALVEK
jgi:drug/metabolite transporter (DMT)-like permease